VTKVTTWLARGMVASISPTVEWVSRFGRSIVLSRMLAPDEFGTAIAITVALSISGIITDVALDRFVLLDSGNKKAQLAAAHVVSIGRAIVIALALWFAAGPIAQSFGVPQFASSFAWAATIPLLEGFSHFGIRQIQRNYSYLPETLAKLISVTVGVVVIFPAVYVFHDHRAMIASFISEKITFLIASHVIAKDVYSLVSDRSNLRAALNFGLPLTLNGFGLAAFGQLDRFFVGHWFGVEALAAYAVILNVGVIPISLIAQTMGRLGVSFLLSDRKTPTALSESYRLMVLLYFLVAVAYSFWVALSLDILTPLIFGPIFVVNTSVHIIITLIAFFRVQRAGAPSILLAATGMTKELAAFNLIGSLGLVAAMLFVSVRPQIESMLLGLLLGDMLALLLQFFMSTARINERSSRLVFDCMVAAVAAFVIAGSIGVQQHFAWPARGIVVVVGLFCIAAQFSIMLARHPRVRNLLFENIGLVPNR
jgi:O-antigen/teichoic acid export membrane protein